LRFHALIIITDVPDRRDLCDIIATNPVASHVLERVANELVIGASGHVDTIAEPTAGLHGFEVASFHQNAFDHAIEIINPYAVGAVPAFARDEPAIGMSTRAKRVARTTGDHGFGNATLDDPSGPITREPEGIALDVDRVTANDPIVAPGNAETVIL